MRLDKLLSNMGYGSRKEVRQYLKNGAVRVNDETEKKSGAIINTDKDSVTLLGEPVVYREFIYLMMNKSGVLN